MRNAIITLTLSVTATLLGACAAPSAEDAPSESGGSAVSQRADACTPKQLAAAEAAYQKTIALSAKNRTDACEEGSTSLDVATQAGLALVHCADYHEKFRYELDSTEYTDSLPSLPRNWLMGQVKIRNAAGRYVWENLAGGIQQTRFRSQYPNEDGRFDILSFNANGWFKYMTMKDDMLSNDVVNAESTIASVDPVKGTVSIEVKAKDTGAIKRFTLRQDVNEVDGQEIPLPSFAITDDETGAVYTTEEVGCHG